MKRADNVPPGGISYIGERGPEIVMTPKPKRRDFTQSIIHIATMSAFFGLSTLAVVSAAGYVAAAIYAIAGGSFLALLAVSAFEQDMTDAEKGAAS